MPSDEQLKMRATGEKRCKACMRADCRKKAREYRQTGRYREQHRIYERSYRALHPEAETAHSMARNRKAVLKKTACERCGVSGCPLHMHHPDHYKPLEVI